MKKYAALGVAVIFLAASTSASLALPELAPNRHGDEQAGCGSSQTGTVRLAMCGFPTHCWSNITDGVQLIAERASSAEDCHSILVACSRDSAIITHYSSFPVLQDCNVTVRRC